MAPPPPTRTSSLAAESQSITSFEVSDHKNRILNTDGTNPSAEQQQQEPRSVTATVQSPREGRVVCILRIAIVAILVVAAVLYSVKVYFYTSGREQADFQKQFSDYAGKVIDSFRVNMEQSLLAADLMAMTYTSYASDRNLTWPFVTLPDFEMRAARASRLIGNGAALGFAPLVTNAERQDWEAYSVTHQESVAQAIAYQKSHPLLYPAGVVSSNNVENVTVTPYVWEFGSKNNIPEKDSSTGTVFPIWQFTPIAAPPVLVNFNELSNPTFVNAITIASGGQVATVSDFFTSFLQESTSSFLSVLFYPVFHNVDDNQTQSVVGMLSVFFSWENMLKGILPSSDANGISVVLGSNCGQAFTFSIVGGNVLFEGNGDLHDRSFDGMEESIELSSILVPGLLQVEDLGCQQSLRLYPMAAFRDDFFTNAPAVYTAVLALTLLLVVILFLYYDWLLRRKHEVLHREAVKSNAIVTSLFPSQVRDRLGRRFSYRMTKGSEQASQRPSRKVRRLSVNFQTPKTKLRTFLKSSESMKSNQ